MPKQEPSGKGPLPRLPAAVLRLLLPVSEREEVLGDLTIEYRERIRRQGRRSAGRWVWRQVLGSVPALVRRGWWRGWSGFSPRSDRIRPGGTMFESGTKDLKYALRRLAKNPTYGILTVLTLALGVAGTAAVFSIARPLLLEPLPVRAEEEVVAFWFEGAWSEAEFAYLRPEMESFRSVAAYRSMDVTLREGDAAARLVPGLAATAELFDVVGVPPAVGPGFQPGDDAPGSEPVAILSHALWEELGARPSIIGERIELSGVTRTVVGVMPEGFWFPDPKVRVWLSEEVDPDNHTGNYGLVGRLPPGVDVAAMDGALGRITQLLDERFDFAEGWDLTKDPELTPIREHLFGSLRPALLALLGAMALILLIACVNVAALMLGQMDGRQTELAVRSALGAGRGRLLRQLVLESLMVGALAGLAGTALAVVGFPFLVGALPLGAMAGSASLDWSLFWSAMTVAMAAATLVALVPGVSVARRDLQASLTRARTGGIGGRGGGLERGLVVVQVALVLLLASSAGLLIRTVENLRAIEPGVDVEGVAVIDVILPEAIAAADRPRVMREIVAAVDALPGVASAAATQRLPLRGSSDNWGIAVEGRPDLEQTTTAFRVVTPDYFETMGVEVLAGRGLDETDRDGEVEEGTVVVSRALADRYLPNEDPIGRRIGFMRRWDRIVGVVENVAESDLSPEPVPARYMVYEQVPFLLTLQTVVLRSREGVEPATLLEPARRALQAAAPGVAVGELTTMERVLDRAVGPALQLMTLLTLLAALALALGVIGIYGVVSHFVTRRKRDWGVRIALGMRPQRVVRQVVARGGLLLVTGIAIGLGMFLVLARLLATLLYGVGTTDPLALLGASGVLLTTGLLAAWIPARRASRVDPADVLREQ